MKVLYDHQIFSTQNYGGVSRYFFELMNYFDKYKEVDFELALSYSNNYYFKNAPFSNHKTFSENKRRWGLLDLLNKRNSKSALRRKDFDVFHPTYYDPYFLKYISKKPFVLTIYDMIHELYPQLFSDNTSEWKRLLAQKAAKIISLSENTKRDILNFYKMDESKIKVIYLGSSLKNNDNHIVPSIKLPNNYILFIGSRTGYKNFDLFIRSVTPLLKSIEDLHVVCVGSGRFSEAESYLFDKLNIEDRVLQYSINDGTLSYLYQKALVFVFPSLYEGFGIPVLEAFSCGCPVVLSNASSFVEVAGEAGIYFDPNDESSIRQAVSIVVYGGDKVRKDLQFKGLEQLKKFSWEKTAKETIAVYKKLL